MVTSKIVMIKRGRMYFFFVDCTALPGFGMGFGINFGYEFLPQNENNVNPFS